MQIDVQCEQCEGTGKVPLESSLLATLALISKRGATAADLSARSHDQITINGFNNRLEKLRHWNLVRRERHGKFYRYFRI